MWITGHKIDNNFGKDKWNIVMIILGGILGLLIFCYWLFELVLGG